MAAETDPAHVGPVHLRLATAQDANTLADIQFDAMAEAMPWLVVIHTRDEVHVWFARSVIPNLEVWVAEVDGRIHGFAVLDPNTGFLDNLYIAPGFQGRGLGSLLLDRIKERSAGRLQLFAFQRNSRAREFYERRGFTQVELGDGSGNDEGEPDVRYEWTGADLHDRTEPCSPGSRQRT